MLEDTLGGCACGVPLLGGLSPTGLLSVFGLLAFFVFGTLGPLFAISQIKENAESYTHLFVMSGGFIAAALIMMAASRISAFGTATVVVPNALWFSLALLARRRAAARRATSQSLDRNDKPHG